MEFETRRLIIKKFIPEYIEVMYNAFGVSKKVNMYISNYKEDWTLDQFGEYILRTYKDENYTRLIVQEKESNKIIGNVSLYQEDSRSKSVIIILNDEYWNKGYGNEILKALIKELKKTKLESLYATCDGRNIGITTILEKNDFELIDKIDGYRKDANGTLGDEYLYELEFKR